MTAYAFVDGAAATEIFTSGPGSPFTSPITGETFAANWLEVASQADREAAGIWPIVEPSPTVFPDKVVSTSLVVTAGPVVTRTPATTAMTPAEKRAAIVAVIDAAETTQLNGSFQGVRGAFGGNGYASYPLSASIRDAMGLYGTLAVAAQLGRRAVGIIDWNGQPADGSTITVNGVTVTFVTGSPSTDEVQIGATSPDTVTAVAAFLNAHTDPRVNQADYRKQGNDLLYITHKTFSTYGNTFTLAAGSSPDPNCDVSGATLTGGRDPAEAADLTWISAYTPHNGDWFGVDDVDSNRWYLDAFEAVRLTRDLTFYVAGVTFFAASNRRAAMDAEAISDDAALGTIWTDVNNPANWDPGAPPIWP